MRSTRFEVLDGWRGISILSVLACHLLPIGPHYLMLNAAFGVLGMSIFFTLSGFLVTHFLILRPKIIDFLVRRFFRILPLAWLYIFVALLLNPVSRETWFAHLLFYANYPPKPLIHQTEHLWSLCVEMHFYVGLALLIGTLKRRGLFLIPIICLSITALRIFNHQYVSVITHFRVDEILAGSVMALIYNQQLGLRGVKIMGKFNYAYILPLLLISCHPYSGFFNYLRPYFSAILVGNTLLDQNTKIANLIKHKWLFYLASISFALYIIHPFLEFTWLGSGDSFQRYSKRPLLFLILFLLAHFSTFYYEAKFRLWGTKLINRNAGIKNAN